MRITAVNVGLLALVFSAAPLRGQGLFTDARQVGMGGVSLTRDSRLERFNPAYRSVPKRAGVSHGPRFTIPIPLGLIQFLSDHSLSSKDPLFNPDSAAFNPVELVNLILNPPLFYEVKKAPTPTNDVAIGIGRDSLQVDLGAAQTLVPADQFGVAGSSRPIDIEPGFKGFRAGVMFWLHDDVEFQLGDTLLAFLKNAQPAQHNAPYELTADGVAELGFAPSVGYSGKIFGDTAHALYVGAAFHYYFGSAYARAIGTGGFTTGDTIFAGSNIVTPRLVYQTQYSKFSNSLGHGVGADLGFVWVSGPLEFGVGVNDIGANITWPETQIDYKHYDTTAATVVLDSTKVGVEAKTKLPIAYIANVAYSTGSTTVGANLFDNGRGAIVSVGVEQRLGVFVVRGGISRDQRKKIEFAGGGGVRFGSFELDAGFWTHSNSLSDERGITLATSFAIY